MIIPSNFSIEAINNLVTSHVTALANSIFNVECLKNKNHILEQEIRRLNKQLVDVRQESLDNEQRVLKTSQEILIKYLKP